jgi:hypothetical protein
VSRGVVAGKVWEYLATGLPIIYTGDDRCDIASTLRGQPGCAIHLPDDVSGIATSLRALDGHRYERDTSSMSRRARSRQLADLLNRSVESPQ